MDSLIQARAVWGNEGKQWKLTWLITANIISSTSETVQFFIFFRFYSVCSLFFLICQPEIGTGEHCTVFRFPINPSSSIRFCSSTFPPLSLFWPLSISVRHFSAHQIFKLTSSLTLRAMFMSIQCFCCCPSFFGRCIKHQQKLRKLLACCWCH